MLCSKYLCFSCFYDLHHPIRLQNMISDRIFYLLLLINQLLLIKRRLQTYDLLVPNHNFQFLILSRTDDDNDDNNKYSIISISCVFNYLN